MRYGVFFNDANSNMCFRLLTLQVSALSLLDRISHKKSYSRFTTRFGSCLFMTQLPSVIRLFIFSLADAVL
jgi:hypothetical protein